MPEDILLGIVPEHEFMNVITLGMALNYQRNSYALWEAVARTYQEEQLRWVFDPREAWGRDIEDLRGALLAHRIALQPNRHPQIWQSVASGIVNSSPGANVQGLLQSVDYDIAPLKTIVQQSRKKEFPYLSGPKIFNYWLYVLESYTAVQWKSRELITIAPDTHILQATVRLGLCPASILEGSAENREQAALAWEQALEGSGLAPIDVHTPLWLWSRAGFPERISI
ncbi:hypothetical protein [Paenibacillus kobensis]|uniref:hypothetical protein n=1 Tax=Paenibacillus kobensis TaxID=59841 RepID=UPI001FE70B92|nr:hypothetical protein [Paenibacillus kobensis]